MKCWRCHWKTQLFQQLPKIAFCYFTYQNQWSSWGFSRPIPWGWLLTWLICLIWNCTFWDIEGPFWYLGGLIFASWNTILVIHGSTGTEKGAPWGLRLDFHRHWRDLWTLLGIDQPKYDVCATAVRAGNSHSIIVCVATRCMPCWPATSTLPEHGQEVPDYFVTICDYFVATWYCFLTIPRYVLIIQNYLVIIRYHLATIQLYWRLWNWNFNSPWRW